MCDQPEHCTKILVAIASYGTANDQYLSQVLEKYRSMLFDVDIVVFSNISKDLAPGIEVVVGLPTDDPWSLPFPHKQLFANRVNDYDVFIYSEDDILITEGNINAFLKASSVIAGCEIPGFLRREISPDGDTNYPEVHWTFHWDCSSIRIRGEYTLAFFTNEHSACYLVTRQQLRRAIDSGGFLVEPHRERYDLLCTAATDPYTQCGFQKLIPISHLDDFTVCHLSNKYVGKLGVDGHELRRQTKALLRILHNGHRPPSLFETETKLRDRRYSKDYYEPVRQEIISAIPKGVQNILSIGCGWGATEACLMKKGMRVVGVPLDPVISGSAQAKGIEIVEGDLQVSRRTLDGEAFDCLLLSNVLHLVRDPIEVLSSFGELLSATAVVVVVVPNLLQISMFVEKMCSDGAEHLMSLRNYEKTGVHFTSHAVVRKWFEDAGMRAVKTIDILPRRLQIVARLAFGLIDPFLASEFICVAKKDSCHSRAGRRHYGLRLHSLSVRSGRGPSYKTC